MARMIPDTPPPETESGAERRLFEDLRDGTSEQLVAYHGVAWQTPGKGGRPQQGESDFVVAHPDFGVLTLEVKGGRVRFDAETGDGRRSGKAARSASRIL